MFSNSNEAICETQLEETVILNMTNDFLFQDLSPGSMLDSMISDTEVDECEIQSKITDWANKNAISSNALSELFKILKKYHPQLPSDPRT